MSTSIEYLKNKARQQVLRSHNYRCDVCMARQGDSGEFLSTEEFVPFDEFVIEWAKKRHRPVVKIHLRVIPIPAKHRSSPNVIHTVLCQRHAMKYLNALRHQQT